MAESHYNNIFNKKNIELELDGTTNKLPYSVDQEITLKKNQIVFTAVNSIFQKLLDNDLYNEAMIKRGVETGTVGAPAFIPDPNNLTNIAELHKKVVLSSENGLSVVHKETEDVSKTLSGRFLDGIKVNKVDFIDDNYLAFTNRGIFKASNKTEWSRDLSAENDIVDVCYNYSFLKDNCLSSYSYFAVANSKDGNVVFYGYDYADRLWKDFSNDPDLSVMTINGAAANKIFTFEDDSTVYVATAGNGLMGASIGFTANRFQTLADTARSEVRAMVSLPTDDEYERYLIATSKGVKQSRKSYGFDDISLEDRENARTFVNDAIKSGNFYYAATNQGVKKIGPNGRFDIAGTEGLVCNSILQASGKIFVGTKDGIGVIIGDNFTRISQPQVEIRHLAVWNNVVFAASDTNVWYSDASAISYALLDESANFANIVQLKVGNGRLYVVTENGIFAYKGGGGSDPISAFDVDQSTCVGTNSIVFGKQISSNEILVQRADKRVLIFKTSNLSEAFREISLDYQVVDATKASESTYFICSKDGTVFEYDFLENGLLNLNEAPYLINVLKIEFSESLSSLIYIAQDGALYSANGNKRLSPYGETYKELLTKNSNVFAIREDGQSVDVFGMVQNSESAEAFFTEKDDNTNIVVAKNFPIYTDAPTAVWNDIYKTVLVTDTIQNGWRHYIAARDLNSDLTSLTAYASELADNIEISADGTNTVVNADLIYNIPNRDSDLKVFLYAEAPERGAPHIVKAINKKAASNTSVSAQTDGAVKAFADACYTSDHGNIINALNFVATGDSVSAVSADKEFLKEEAGLCANDALGIDGTVFLAKDDGLYQLNSDYASILSSENFIIAAGGVSANSLAAYDNRILLAAGKGKGILLSSDIINPIIPMSTCYDEFPLQRLFERDDETEISAAQGAILSATLKTISTQKQLSASYSTYFSAIEGSEIVEISSTSDLSDSYKVSSVYKNDNGEIIVQDDEQRLYLAFLGKDDENKTRICLSAIPDEVTAYASLEISDIIALNDMNRKTFEGLSTGYDLHDERNILPAGFDIDDLYDGVDLERLYSEVIANNAENFEITIIDADLSGHNGYLTINDAALSCVALEGTDLLSGTAILSLSGDFFILDPDEEPPKEIVISSDFCLQLSSAGIEISTIDFSELFTQSGNPYAYLSAGASCKVSLRIKLYGEPGIKFGYSSVGTVSETMTIGKSLPIIKETLDGLYYDSVFYKNHIQNYKPATGFFFKISDNEYLAYDGLNFIKFSEDKFEKMLREEDTNLAFLTISNGLFYFNLSKSQLRENNTDLENLVRKTTIDSNTNKSFLIARDASDLSSVREISFENSRLFAVSYDRKTIYCATSDEFPGKLSKISPFESNSEATIRKIASTTNKTFFYSTDKKLRCISSDLTIIEDDSEKEITSLFVSEDTAYAVFKNNSESRFGIYKLDLDSSDKISYTLMDKINASDEILAYVQDDDRFENKVALTKDDLYVKQKAFSFDKDDFYNISVLTSDSEILDLKVVNEFSQKPIVVAFCKDKLLYRTIDMREGLLGDIKECEFEEIGSSGGSIYFSQDLLNCYRLFGSTMLKDEVSINSANEISLGENIYTVENFVPTEKTKMFSFGNDYRPCIVSDKALYEISNASSFGRSYVLESQNQLIGFARDSRAFESNVYLNSDEVLYALTYDESQQKYTLQEKSQDSKYSALKGIGQNLAWCFSGSNKAFGIDIAGGAQDKEVIYNGGDFNTVKVLFYSGSNVYIGDRNGLSKEVSKTPSDFAKDDGDAIHRESEGKSGISRLELFSSDWVFSYLNNGETAFASSSEDVASVLSELSFEGQDKKANIITLINNRYLLISDGADAYIYSLANKTIDKINVDQLRSLNSYDGFLNFVNADSSRNLIGYGHSLITFTGFAPFRMFTVPTSQYAIVRNSLKNNCTVLDTINDVPDFIAGTTSGVKYIYNQLMTRTFFDYDSDVNIDGNVSVIKKILITGEKNDYLVGQENELFKITDLMGIGFSRLLELDEDVKILDVYVIQDNEYIIATNKGIYTTDLKYRFVDDLRRFTVEGVVGIINEELQKIIAKHIEDEHGERDPITLVNKKADVEMSFMRGYDKHYEMLDSFTSNSVRIVRDDIIDTIERGGESPEEVSYVKAAVQNWATRTLQTESLYAGDGFVAKFTDPSSGKTFDLSTIPYLVKNWKSGLKEIYIYVPSTATYYINNPEGISNSPYSYKSLYRKNVGTSAPNSLDSACTTLRIYLYNSHFKIKTILAAQCSGNSLPLKIYKDNVNEDDNWKGFFDTVIQPSALRTLPMTMDKNVNNVRSFTDDLERVCLDFSVYGTDAQAIRIIAES